MASGDQVLIDVKRNLGCNIIKKCGVSFVYEDENINETEEEDAVLGYYKSWNHIIGGDLSPFQTTTGEYYLNKDRFCSNYIHYNPFARITAYKEPTSVFFKAFSQRKSKTRSRAIEDVTK